MMGGSPGHTESVSGLWLSEGVLDIFSPEEKLGPFIMVLVAVGMEKSSHWGDQGSEFRTLGSGINLMDFEKWSMMIIITVFLWDSGRSVMKSIARCYQG